MRKLFLDLETSGLTPRFGADIVEASVVDIEGKVVYSSLARPERKIPKSAIRIHGITNEDVAEAPPSEAVRRAVYRVCEGAEVGIYNAQFDLRFLPQLSAYASVFCMLGVVGRELGKRLSLNDALEVLKCDVSAAGAHRATRDAAMTAMVYRALKERASKPVDTGMRMNGVALETFRNRVFKNWGEVPGGVVTRTQLRKQGLQPGGVVFAKVNITRGHRYRIGEYPLYLLSEAKPVS